MIRERILKIVLVLVGLLFLVFAYPLTEWNRPEIAPEQMLGSVYVTLGLFLLWAVRNPAANRSLIAFAAWSSIAHSATMAMQAYRHLIPRGDFLVAVVPLGVIGLLLVAFTPARTQSTASAT